LERARVKILALFSSPMSNNSEKFVAYKFYRRVRNGEDQFIGTLPERRKNPERITYASIMNWAKILVPEDVLNDRIYFVRIEI